LLADQLVALHVVETISYETVRQTVSDTLWHVGRNVPNAPRRCWEQTQGHPPRYEGRAVSWIPASPGSVEA
jgi:hypothetical protein